jgi:hypothetical protein
MPETTEAAAQPTSDETVQNTGAESSGAVTQTAQAEGSQNIDITQTPEFKAALTAAIEKKIPQLKKQIARDITGEKEGQPSVEELQQQLEATRKSLQGYEARAAIREYLNDPKHNITAPPEALGTIEELVLNRLEYGEDGKPANLKDAINTVKTTSPVLFVAHQGSLNGNNGRNSAQPVNMNALLRQAAGRT